MPDWQDYLTKTPKPSQSSAGGPREVMRKPEVLACTGISNSQLYNLISQGRFPRPIRLDPESKTVVWFRDEISAYQQAAIDRAKEREVA